MKLKSVWIKMGVIFLLIAAAIDIVYLNYRVLTAQKMIVTPPISQNTLVEQDKTQIDSTGESTNTAGYNNSINEATAALTLRIEEIEKTLKKPVSTVGQSSGLSQSVKEYYIPLGSGTTTSSTWTDMPGVEAYVVPANYGTLSEMYLEASPRIPTGNGRVYLRLLNVTDNVSLIESEIYQEGNKTGLLSSGKIPIPYVSKLYRIQIKSTLGYEAILDNARIKIFVK